MRLKSKRSSEGSSGSNRLRLTILLATVAAFLLVPAAQAFANGSGIVDIEGFGGGSGEISSVGGVTAEEFGEGSPAIECSGPPATGTCENELFFYEEEGVDMLGLHAYPDPGSVFVGYAIEEGEGLFEGGYCEEEEGGFTGNEKNWPCFIYTGHNENIKVTAYFECETEGGCEEGPAGPPLTTIIEEGTGTVVSNPAGIECTGSAPHECTTEEIAEGETVTLTASPAAGYQFKSWKYCDSGGVHGRQCTITLTENHKPVGAKFAAANDVSVEKTGNGTGSITGVTCGNTCTAATGSIVASKTVTLKAKPYAKNSEFLGWSASPVSCTLSEEGKTCSLGLLGANETVEAEFAEIARENLTLTKSGSGQGSVKSAPAGINCSYTCGSNTAYFYKGTSVTLTAAVQVGKGSALGSWGGACSGSEATPCVVSMSSAKSVTAEFE